MTKIFIAEEIPSLNKGEEAILYGFLETFKMLGDVEVSLFSLNPEVDRANYANIRIINGMGDLHLLNNLQQRSTFIKVLESTFALFQYLLFAIFCKVFGLNSVKIMKGEIWREYCKADLIIIGHDGTFSSPFTQVLVFSHICNIFLARLLRKPVVVYAGDAIYGAYIGIFKKKLWTILAKFLLNKVDLITLREEISYEYLQKIGVSKLKIYVTADTAFLLKPAPEKRVREIMSQENINKNKEPIIGMTVTQIMFRYAFPRLRNPKEKYESYIKLMAQVVDYLIDTLGATVAFLPHCIGTGNKLDDRIPAKDIFQMAKNKPKIKVIVNEYTASELKGVIGQFDLFIGERAHSVISSTSMYVPSLSITFSLDPRTHGIIGKMLGQEKWVYNIEKFDFNTLVSKINNLWLGREKAKRDLITKVDAVKKRAMLNGELLKNLLRSDKR